MSTTEEQPKETLDVLKLRRELEQVIIKVNYHFQSGYERHVNLQTPESVFLNFLKKMIAVVPFQYLSRVCKKDFILTMEEGYVVGLSFHYVSHKHDWRDLDARLKMLGDAAKSIDFSELRAKSHTLDKWYQKTDQLINSIKDFSFK